MEYIIKLPVEIAEVYRLSAIYLNKTIEEILQEALINYIGTCLH